MIFLDLVQDIIIKIYNKLESNWQLHFKLTSIKFAKYEITNLKHHMINYKLTNNILKLHPYIIKLNIKNNGKITDVSYLTRLRELNISNECAYPTNVVGNSGIFSLTNLTKLNAYGNIKLTNIDHLINLQKLNIGGECGVNKIGFLTNLTKLHTGRNKIDINHLTSLLNLSISYYSIYSDIKSLTNLTKLSMHSDTICNINHFVNLRTLHIKYSHGCLVTNTSISSLTNLTELDIARTTTITNINSLINLRILDISCSIMDNNGISLLTNLVNLDCWSNTHITDINTLTGLQILNAGYECGLDNNGISSLTNLVHLDILYNTHITDVNHLLNLKALFGNEKLRINNKLEMMCKTKIHFT